MNLLRFIRVKVLRRFINLRVLSEKNLPYDEIIRVELLVAMCLMALCFGVIYIVAGLMMNISFMVVLNYLLFFFTAIPAVLFLIRKGYHNQAKLVMMILGTIFMVIKAASLGPDSGMNLSMLIILFATFAFYTIEDYKYILLSLVITLGSILFLEITDYAYLGHDPATNKYEYEYNFISTILFCILFFYVILRVNQYINKKLSRLNQKLLNKNKKLGKINEELDSYVYKASHDMRAPLTSLMGIVNLIKTEKDPEKIQLLVEMQEKCITKLDNHIYQIINLSKNAKIDLIPEKTDLEEMIYSIFEELNFFENAARTEKIIRIKQETDFYSDHYRLKIILNNLISNAFKYARKNEEHPIIEIDIIVSSRDASITIHDNGIGIPEDKQTKVFDMFYRGTAVSKGSGLGLYMVKEMIIRLNGTISVKAEENRFTSIHFVVPNLANGVNGL